MKLEWDFKELEIFASRLQDAGRFEEFGERLTKAIAKALLKRIKSLTPTDTYELINGWDRTKIAVVERADGFECLLVNDTPYALAVNDGHKAYNQYGGPYPVKRRIQVRSPHKWQQGDKTYYVFGHFFVERGIVQLTATKEIESIIYRELLKWWSECLNG